MGWLEVTRPWALALFSLLLLVFWLHRDRRRELATDRLDLWRRALARVPAARRSRLTLQLLVTLAIVVCLVLGAAGVRRRAVEGFRRVHVVIDASGSMAAADALPASALTRFAAASDAAATLRVPSGVAKTRWSIVGDRLDAWRPTTVPAGRARLELARELAARVAPHGCVVLFSDGAGPSPWPAPLPANLFLRGVGRKTRNPAILALRVRDPWPGPQLALEVEALAGPGARLVVEHADGARRELALAASGPTKLDLPRRGGGALRIRLLPDDPQPADNEVTLHVQRPFTPRLLALPEDRGRLAPIAEFLAVALGAERFASRASFEAAVSDGGPARPALLLVDGGRLPRWPDDGALRVLFGTELPGLAGSSPLARHLEWDREDELLQGLDLSGVAASGTRRLAGRLPPAARVLAWHGPDPFLLVSRRHGLLWFGGELETSNLSVQPFLPVLVLRALGRLAEPGRRTRVDDAHLDPAESRIAAREPGSGRGEPVLYRPPVEFWPWLLGAALALFTAHGVATIRHGYQRQDSR